MWHAAMVAWFLIVAGPAGVKRSLCGGSRAIQFSEGRRMELGGSGTSGGQDKQGEVIAGRPSKGG